VAVELAAAAALSVLVLGVYSSPAEAAAYLGVSSGGWTAVGVIGAAFVGAFASIVNTYLITSGQRRLAELERKVDAPRTISTRANEDDVMLGPDDHSPRVRHDDGEDASS
jgi:hypothetical protein